MPCNSLSHFLRHTRWFLASFFNIFLLLVTPGGSQTWAAGMEIRQVTNLTNLTHLAKFIVYSGYILVLEMLKCKLDQTSVCLILFASSSSMPDPFCFVCGP